MVAHVDAMESIPGVNRGLIAGDDLQCGEFTIFKNYDKKFMTLNAGPGHTMSHICLYFSGNSREKPALFCGKSSNNPILYSMLV